MVARTHTVSSGKKDSRDQISTLSGLSHQLAKRSGLADPSGLHYLHDRSQKRATTMLPQHTSLPCARSTSVEFCIKVRESYRGTRFRPALFDLLRCFCPVLFFTFLLWNFIASLPVLSHSYFVFILPSFSFLYSFPFHCLVFQTPFHLNFFLFMKELCLNNSGNSGALWSATLFSRLNLDGSTSRWKNQSLYDSPYGKLVLACLTC